MEFMITGAAAPYLLRRPEDIPAPRLLVFHDRVEYNIRRLRELLQTVNSSLDLTCVWPHVKTVKSAWAVKLLMQHGIGRFKATMNEVDMLVRCGADHIFVSYPLMSHDALYLARLAASHPHIQFYVQVGHPRHAEILKKILRDFDIKWHYLIDMNVGMDRTGLPAEQAVALFQSLATDDRFVFSGLHAYDGHVHQVSEDERRDTAMESMARLRKSHKLFTNHGVKVPMTIVSGTPGFLLDAEILKDASLPSKVYYSPGTWVYFDTQSREMLPDTFELAALILAQVIDRPTAHTATLNLGHKRWAVDQGPIEAFSEPGMKAESWSEEHTVVSGPTVGSLDIGDYLLIAPRHVCPTVNLWEHFVVVDSSGHIERTAEPVDARNH